MAGKTVDDDDNSVVDVDEANIYAKESCMFRYQAGASSAVDEGSVDDPGGDTTDVLDSFSNLATSTTGLLDAP